MKYIKITKEQAEEIKGRHGIYSSIEPINYNGSYIIPESVLTDDDLMSIREKVESFNGEIIEPIFEQKEVEIKQVETVPEKITKLQLKVQLVTMGYDLQLIEDAIKQLQEPQRTIAMLAWTDATNIYRDNSFITMVAQILQLTEKQVDQIFIEGEKIKL